jgi:hypothetical protein
VLSSSVAGTTNLAKCRKVNEERIPGTTRKNKNKLIALKLQNNIEKILK